MPTKELISGYPKRNIVGTFPMSAHGTLVVCGEEMNHMRQWFVYSTIVFSYKGQENIRAPVEVHLIFKTPLEFFFIHTSLLIFCYGPKKKKKPHKIVFKPNQRERKKQKNKKHTNGMFKTRKHIKIHSPLLQLSGNDQRKLPVPFAHSWKSLTIT